MTLSLTRTTDGTTSNANANLNNNWTSIENLANAADPFPQYLLESALEAALEASWPVGSIYIAAVSTNPATLLGFGTWAAFGAGRVPVGIDAGQTEFDTVEETGGAKTHTLTTAELASHTHVQDAHTHTQNAHNHGLTDFNAPTDTNATGAQNRISNAGSGLGSVTDSTVAVNQSTTATNQNAGSGSAHNNLQPYIVVYMWKRTA